MNILKNEAVGEARGREKLLFSQITHHNQVRGRRTGSNHSGAEDYYQEKKTKEKTEKIHITEESRILH